MIQPRLSHLTAFMSCSFADEFEEPRRFFKDLIASCGFEPLLLTQSVGLSVPEKIRQAIRRSDVLVAIIFDEASAYVLNEIGMAYSLGIPVVMLRDRTAKVEGIAKNITDYLTFDLQQYWRSAPDVVQLLLEVGARLQKGSLGRDLMVRNYVKSHVSITEAEVRNVTEVSLLNLSDRLSQVSHGLLFYNEYERETATSVSFDVEVLTPQFTASVDQRLSGGGIQATISFHPPLRRGQVVTYAYTSVTPNYYPLDRRSLDSLIASGKYHLDVPRLERHFTVSTPTEALDLRIQIPAGYRLYDEGVGVRYYKADIILTDEEDRIRAGGHFRREDFAGTTTLELNVPFPKLFATYTIYWTPDD